jgi:hypothetical protein
MCVGGESGSVNTVHQFAGAFVANGPTRMRGVLTSLLRTSPLPLSLDLQLQVLRGLKGHMRTPSGVQLASKA